MTNVLGDEYLPEKIFHRDEQLKKIRNVFINFKKYKAGTNLLIIGVSGSGKTTLIRKVIKEEDNSLFVSGNETKTSFKKLKNLFELKCQYRHEAVEEAINILKKNPKIIIVDEIDKIVDFHLLINDLNLIYRKTMIPIIIISYKRDILSKMSVDALRTLYFERINLSSYNSFELRDIIEERLKLLGIDKDQLPGEFIPYLSAVSAKSGSCRLALNILLRCLQNGNFSKKFIEEIYENLMKEDWAGFYDEINSTEKKFLCVLLNNCNDKEEINLERLQFEMKKEDFPLTISRISQMVNTFERYSVVISKHKNMGRGGGRKRMVRFLSKEVYNSVSKLNIY